MFQSANFFPNTFQSANHCFMTNFRRCQEELGEALDGVFI